MEEEDRAEGAADRCVGVSARLRQRWSAVHRTWRARHRVAVEAGDATVSEDSAMIDAHAPEIPDPLAETRALGQRARALSEARGALREHLSSSTAC